ncbi:MAG TPA: hypothetical protein VGP68_10945, partial [Gemmataceae bacterium]|nr:hypothetical protein [Gemmataceae bacterium]
RISTGALQPDGLRVVSGVKADDLIVVGALQQVRQRMQIKPEPVPMPSLGTQTNTEVKAPVPAKEAAPGAAPSVGIPTNPGTKKAPASGPKGAQL